MKTQTAPPLQHVYIPNAARVRLSTEARDKNICPTRHDRTGTVIGSAGQIVSVRWDGEHREVAYHYSFLERV